MSDLGYIIEDREPRPLTRLMWAFSQSLSEPILLDTYIYGYPERIDTYLLYKAYEMSIKGDYIPDKSYPQDENTIGIDTWNTRGGDTLE